MRIKLLMVYIILSITYKLSAQTINVNLAAYTDESSFVNSFSAYGFKKPDQIDLNRRAVTGSAFKSVYGFNIPDDKFPIGFKWNSGDEETNEWRPQGIAGFNWIGKKFLLVSWYAREEQNMEHKGSRVSLIDVTDMNNITYRHILLVQSITNKTNSLLFKQASSSYVQMEMYIPIVIHAGGISYYNGKLYVAQTNLGFRVFDLNKFVEAESNEKEDSLGKMSNGKLKAFNYRYILPEVGYYKCGVGSPFSCVELGEGTSSSEKILWSGQYITESDGKGLTVPVVTGFSIFPQGISGSTVKTIKPKDKDDNKVYGMQGVYRAGNKTYMSITGTSWYEGSSARLVIYEDGAVSANRYRWPHGAEDLYLENYYDPSSGKTIKYLWCLTEYETEKFNKDNRCVFAVRLTDYD